MNKLIFAVSMAALALAVCAVAPAVIDDLSRPTFDPR
jgi:hypothetical protein